MSFVVVVADQGHVLVLWNLSVPSFARKLRKSMARRLRFRLKIAVFTHEQGDGAMPDVVTGLFPRHGDHWECRLGTGQRLCLIALQTAH